ncbi:MAG: hypothetical protein ABIQ70_05030, partial [Dokdonella sp.]
MTAQGAVSSTPVDPILAHQSSRLGGAQLRDAQSFASEFLRRVPAEDLALRSAADWAALVQGVLDFVRERHAGAAKVSVSHQVAGESGFDASRTIVDVVTDDMPFLVDSV